MGRTLGARMKRYEEVSKPILTERLPVLVRLDMRAGHTFTEGFVRPYDSLMSNAMKAACKYLVENVQPCVLAYTQSDEISLLLINYKNLDSQSWFDNEVEKIVSITASMATLAFNVAYQEEVSKFLRTNTYYKEFDEDEYESERYLKYVADCKQAEIYKSRIVSGLFDSRVFVLPKEEVANYFIWRQQDASRNSVQMFGRANFSDKQMQGKKNNEIRDMLFTKKDINWNDQPVYQKRGICVYNEAYQIEKPDAITGQTNKSTRNRIVVDEETPIFAKNREYIDNYVNPQPTEADLERAARKEAKKLAESKTKKANKNE